MPCSNLRFLVVEDHDFQRLALMQMLRNLGAEHVYGAENGHEALQVVHDPDRPVDIVISDLAMPGMDGMELIRHLSEAGASVSLILASALQSDLLASVANMALAYKVKLLGIVSKPTTAVKLAPLIAQHRASAPAHAGSEAKFTQSEIAQAWAQDQFEPWFEPKVDLGSMELLALQAKPHWRHPTQGVLPPHLFMDSVRAYGLNDDLVWLVLRKAAAQCRRWHAQGLELGLSVNLNLDSLADIHLASRVVKVAMQEQLEPRHVVLNVAESSLNTELAKALENLARLRVAGFGLGVDDFGSGHMSREQLSLVAFTELKVHCNFGSVAGDDESVRAGLAVALEMAASLKLKTVADGIRFERELKLLREWGYDMGQGHYLSWPMAGDAVPGWAEQWRLDSQAGSSSRSGSAGIPGGSSGGDGGSPAGQPAR